MTSNFVLIIAKDVGLKKLSDLAIESFGISNFRQVSQNSYISLDNTNKLIITITPESLEFNLGNLDKTEFENKIFSIRNFILKNFANETLGIKYYDNNCNLFNNLGNVTIFNLT